MNMVKHTQLTADELQMCLMSGVHLFPSVYAEFLHQLALMESRGKLSMLPLTIFERYHLRLQDKKNRVA